MNSFFPQFFHFHFLFSIFYFPSAYLHNYSRQSSSRTDLSIICNRHLSLILSFLSTAMWTPPSKSPPRPSGPLFPTTLISPAVSSSLPANYTIRPLQRSDYTANHLDPLRVLTKVGDISQEAWESQYDSMAKVPDTYFLLVVCDDRGKIVGTGTLLKERKLLVSSM